MVSVPNEQEECRLFCCPATKLGIRAWRFSDCVKIVIILGAYYNRQCYRLAVRIILEIFPQFHVTLLNFVQACPLHPFRAIVQSVRRLRHIPALPDYSRYTLCICRRDDVIRIWVGSIVAVMVVFALFGSGLGWFRFLGIENQFFFGYIWPGNWEILE